MNLGDAHDRGVLTGERSVRNLEHRLAKVFIQICLPMLGVIYRLEQIRLNTEVTIYFCPVIVLTNQPSWICSTFLGDKTVMETKVSENHFVHHTLWQIVKHSTSWGSHLFSFVSQTFPGFFIICCTDVDKDLSLCNIWVCCHPHSCTLCLELTNLVST